MRVAPHLLALAVCLCVWLTSCTAQGEECGENPMKQVLIVAKRTGKTLTHVLTLLQDIDPPAYEILARKFRMYAACVGLVDTGYFKKRSSPLSRSGDHDDDDYFFSQLRESLERQFQDQGRTWEKQHKDRLLLPEHFSFLAPKRSSNRDRVRDKLVEDEDYFR